MHTQVSWRASRRAGKQAGRRTGRRTGGRAGRRVSCLANARAQPVLQGASSPRKSPEAVELRCFQFFYYFFNNFPSKRGGAADRMPGQAMNRNSCLARWVDAPVHTLPMGACTGAQLDKGTLLCRCGQLCQLVFRCSTCKFSAARPPRMAIGGAFCPGKANEKALC